MTKIKEAELTAFDNDLRAVNRQVTDPDELIENIGRKAAWFTYFKEYGNVPRRKKDCLDFNLIAGYTDKNLNKKETKIVEKHIKTCKCCKMAVETNEEEDNRIQRLELDIGDNNI